MPRVTLNYNTHGKNNIVTYHMLSNYWCIVCLIHI